MTEIRISAGQREIMANQLRASRSSEKEYSHCLVKSQALNKRKHWTPKRLTAYAEPTCLLMKHVREGTGCLHYKVSEVYVL